jgi:hypothetical protein
MSTDVAASDAPGADENRGRSRGDGLGLIHHGIGLRGQVAPSEGARFGRMFPKGASLDLGVLSKLAALMRPDPNKQFNPNPSIAAGYTYFAQFVDHDLTFDATSMLDGPNDPDLPSDFRTPRFDLDSLYGSGPLDQPFLYDWEQRPHRGVKLLVGHNPEGPEFAAEDLPRNHRGRALTGDPRNDENLIISQLHLLFIKFHNRVVDQLAEDQTLSSPELFERAQELVRWHYQYIVKTDLLPQLVGDALAEAEPKHFTWSEDDPPFMPVEFSAAAFRFGHSMVRPDYTIRDDRPAVPILFSEPGGATLAGLRRLPAELEIEWKRFFPIDPRPEVLQMSMRIDPYLVEQLSHLPPDGASLAYLNLRRGSLLELPTGTDVATALGEPCLSDDDLLAPPLPADIDEDVRKLVVEATPLWYYVLCEARHPAPVGGDGGQGLGRVGGRIVAEVINGLLAADPRSYVRKNPAWTPNFAGDDGLFKMADLVKFAQGAPRDSGSR